LVVAGKMYLCILHLLILSSSLIFILPIAKPLPSFFIGLVWENVCVVTKLYLILKRKPQDLL